MRLGRKILVSFTEQEAVMVRAIADELGISAPELIRSCVNAELARKTGDPKAMEALTAMFKTGIDEWVKARVDFEISRRKKEQGKKRA